MSLQFTEPYELLVLSIIVFSAKLKGNLESFSQTEGVLELELNQSTLAPSLTWLLKISEREYW